MSLLRRRSKGRSCTLHGDNGCEIQGEAGPRERVHDKRAVQREIDDALAEVMNPDYRPPSLADLRKPSNPVADLLALMDSMENSSYRV